MAKVYLETTIISYLAAWPSRDLITAGHQQVTHEWWRKRRGDFDLYVSQRVVDEVRGGDEDAVRRRLAFVQGLPLLDLNDEVARLADDLVRGGALPEAAMGDAIHVAVATVHRMDFLLTWNCRHIANAELRRALAPICTERGYELPHICTPEELLGEHAIEVSLP